jgi:hypothetical protein
MDRAIYKVVTYVAIGLALVYLFEHSDLFVNQVRMFVNDWWR